MIETGLNGKCCCLIACVSGVWYLSLIHHSIDPVRVKEQLDTGGRGTFSLTSYTHRQLKSRSHLKNPKTWVWTLQKPFEAVRTSQHVLTGEDQPKETQVRVFVCHSPVHTIDPQLKYTTVYSHSSHNCSPLKDILILHCCGDLYVYVGGGWERRESLSWRDLAVTCGGY